MRNEFKGGVVLDGRVHLVLGTRKPRALALHLYETTSQLTIVMANDNIHGSECATS